MMRKKLIIFISFSIPFLANARTIDNNPELLIFGGMNHNIFLGCINCDKYDSSSIWNKYNDYGSKYSDSSIWNKYGDFGSKYSDLSPLNKYASNPPVIVDRNGNFYGNFTSNRYNNPSSYNLAQIIIEYYDEIQNDTGEVYQIITGY